MSDDEIDLDDIPESDPANQRWARRPGLEHRGGVAKLEPEVLEWALARMGERDLDVVVNEALRLLMRVERDLAPPAPLAEAA